MSRVITFARQFPVTHPKAGQPTNFLPKIWESFGEVGHDLKLTQDINLALEGNWNPKKHTIRSGNRWKKGDMFSPRVWSGRPYCSRQVRISDDKELHEVWDIEIDIAGDSSIVRLEGKYLSRGGIERLAENDGLSYEEFKAWFNKPLFTGQVLVWDKSIKLEDYVG